MGRSFVPDHTGTHSSSTKVQGLACPHRLNLDAQK